MRLRKLLLKLAHRILKKYGVIPLDFKDKVFFMGTIYEIQSYVISKEIFKTDVTIEMCDCLKLPDFGES